MTAVTSVDIPVPIYLQKYLEKRYGKEHKVSSTSAIGLFVIELSSKYYVKPVKNVPKCDGVFSLPVTKFYYNQKVFRITRKKLQKLTKLLVKLFYEDLVSSISRNIELGHSSTAKGALKEYLNYYHINENDLKLETAYMEYQRKSKQKIKELKKIKTNSF